MYEQNQKDSITNDRQLKNCHTNFKITNALFIGLNYPLGSCMSDTLILIKMNTHDVS